MFETFKNLDNKIFYLNPTNSLSVKNVQTSELRSRILVKSEKRMTTIYANKIKKKNLDKISS